MVIFDGFRVNKEWQCVNWWHCFMSNSYIWYGI